MKRSKPLSTAGWIALARQILQPKPVDLGRFPRWFPPLVRQCRDRRGIAASICPLQSRYEIKWNLGLATGIADARSIFDHWGRIGDTLVSEPYISRETIELAFKLADTLGCDVEIEPNSWHYPGNTTRIEFTRRG